MASIDTSRSLAPPRNASIAAAIGDFPRILDQTGFLDQQGRVGKSGVGCQRLQLAHTRHRQKIILDIQRALVDSELGENAGERVLPVGTLGDLGRPCAIKPDIPDPGARA
jgi:hypothetical protein